MTKGGQISDTTVKVALASAKALFEIRKELNSKARNRIETELQRQHQGAH
ncbi:hypothetical protein [Reinekea sp. G2M2-21]|nr:hypothetical protein [Reinekea sp. G2M2-21]